MRWCTKIDKYQVCMNPRRKIITLLKVHHTITKMHCTTDQADGINVKMHHYCKIKASNFTFIPGDTSLLKTPLKKIDPYISRKWDRAGMKRMELSHFIKTAITRQLLSEYMCCLSSSPNICSWSEVWKGGWGKTLEAGQLCCCFRSTVLAP